MKSPIMEQLEKMHETTKEHSSVEWQNLQQAIEKVIDYQNDKHEAAMRAAFGQARAKS